MAGAIVVTVCVILAAILIRKQFKKGQWTKSCVGCAGKCGGACHSH